MITQEMYLGTAINKVICRSLNGLSPMLPLMETEKLNRPPLVQLFPPTKLFPKGLIFNE